MSANQKYLAAGNDSGEPGQREVRLARVFAALLIAAYVALMLASAWIEIERTVASSDEARPRSMIAESMPQFEYFPGKYVNRATEVEKPVESF